MKALTETIKTPSFYMPAAAMLIISAACYSKPLILIPVSGCVIGSSFGAAFGLRGSVIGGLIVGALAFVLSQFYLG